MDACAITRTPLLMNRHGGYVTLCNNAITLLVQSTPNAAITPLGVLQQRTPHTHTHPLGQPRGNRIKFCGEYRHIKRTDRL